MVSTATSSRCNAKEGVPYVSLRPPRYQRDDRAWNPGPSHLVTIRCTSSSPTMVARLAGAALVEPQGSVSSVSVGVIASNSP